MAEENKNTSEVQEETEQNTVENETVTEVQEESPEATAGEESTAETSEEASEEKPEGKAKTSFFKKKKDKNGSADRRTDRSSET